MSILGPNMYILGANI